MVEKSAFVGRKFWKIIIILYETQHPLKQTNKQNNNKILRLKYKINLGNIAL